MGGGRVSGDIFKCYTLKLKRLFKRRACGLDVSLLPSVGHLRAASHPQFQPRPETHCLPGVKTKVSPRKKIRQSRILSNSSGSGGSCMSGAGREQGRSDELWRTFARKGREKSPSSSHVDNCCSSDVRRCDERVTSRYCYIRALQPTE